MKEEITESVLEEDEEWEYEYEKKIKRNGVRRSAKSFLSFSRAQSLVECHEGKELPEKGKIFIYNTIFRGKFTDGVPYREHRGFARVVEYYPHIVVCEEFIRPEIMRQTSFMITDFNVGLIDYFYIEDIMYQCNYSYEELDISNLHLDIQKMVIRKDEVGNINKRISKNY